MVKVDIILHPDLMVKDAHEIARKIRCTVQEVHSIRACIVPVYVYPKICALCLSVPLSLRLLRPSLPLPLPLSLVISLSCSVRLAFPPSKACPIVHEIDVDLELSESSPEMVPIGLMPRPQKV